MKQLITMEMLQKDKEILENIFDLVRIVDPLKKIVLKCDDEVLVESGQHCYEFHGHKNACKNCISMRALKHKSDYFKLEYDNEKIYMFMAVPIQAEKRTAVLELAKDVTGSVSDDYLKLNSDSKLMDIINSLNQQQIRDGLTDLYNRRYIDERLPVDILNSTAENKPLSIIMADIDHFKKVNDTYGHVAGDFILKEFSAILQDHAESLDGWAARYGGEEFIICLYNTDSQIAEKAAEEIRQKLENSVFRYNDNQIRITSSFGVSTVGRSEKISAEDLIVMVDKNLYKAKQNGRNRVVSDFVLF